MNRHAEFYSRLAKLLDEFDVDLVAADDGADYGQQCGRIEVQFNADGYRCDSLEYLGSDTAKELAKGCRRGE